MRRALVQARMEIQKFRINAAAGAAKEKIPLLGGRSNSVLGRLAGAFSIVDYAIFAYKTVRWLFFRKRR